VLVSTVAHTTNIHHHQPSPVWATEVNIHRLKIYHSNSSKTPQISHRDVCFALGKIIFSLFSEDISLLAELTGTSAKKVKESADKLQIECIDSKGEKDTSLTALKRSPMAMNTEGVDAYEENDLGHNLMLPEPKKAFLVRTTQIGPLTKSMRARDSLQSEGLPHFLCQLISDLLDAEEGNLYVSDASLPSLEEAQHDLLQLQLYPERLLQDNACPRKALEKTNLFNQVDDEVYGRENEQRILTDMVTRVSQRDPSSSPSREDFLCEAAFLSGHSGSGKSSLMKYLVSECNDNDWSVVFCKFDHQAAPLSILLQSFDTYFGKFLPPVGDINFELGPSMQEIFDRMSQNMKSLIHNESYSQLCQLLPKFSQLFSMTTLSMQKTNTQIGSNSLANYMNQTAQVQNASCDGNVGSGGNRLLYLLQVLFKTICSGGRPVLLCVDDLQWANEFTIDIIGDIIAGGHGPAFTDEGKYRMILLGSFRADEVPEDGLLMTKIKLLEQSQENIKVTKLFVGELTEHDINKMLSFKLCLPMRYIRELTQIVLCKTRGHPLFVVQFLRLLIQRDIISFSVKSRRWVWDYDTIDMQMISDDVAEFLTKKLEQLPEDMIKAIKVASCIGCYVNMATIQLLDLGQFVPANRLLRSFESAVKEGVMEKAGSIFAFTHDMLWEASYNLVAEDERESLHRKIGWSLIVQVEEVNGELLALAADQINKCKDVLAPSDRDSFARINLAAGKHSMSTSKSNYQQACGYFEAGISLLNTNNWDKQYSLSLELYESSVAVSFMIGKVQTVSSRLMYILSKAKSFDDTLNPRVLLAKLLVSQERYAEATDGVFAILSSLGEDFPREMNASLVSSEIEAITPILQGITKEKVLNLPAMTAKTKLHAMKFMDLLLTTVRFVLSPMLMHAVSCRMTKLAFSFGFCDECISGLVVVSHAILHYSDDVWLATKICRVAESLVESHKNPHLLRARLASMISAVLFFVEPFQASLERCMKGHCSGVIEGDIDTAMLCGLGYAGGSLFSTDDLINCQKILLRFMSHMSKHKRISALRSSMAYLNAYAALIGNKDTFALDADIQVQTNDTLYQIAKETQNGLLLHQVILTQMFVHVYFREYLPCVILAEKYDIKRKATRSFDIFMMFYTWIAALALARDTKLEKWKMIGEKSVRIMSQFVEYSSWNFENKHMLLQAELHYLNGRHEMAESAYTHSIHSAHEHRFIMEEALAYELFGTYFLENKHVDKGMEQLQLACDRYKQAGALKRADTVNDFMVLARQAHRGWWNMPR